MVRVEATENFTLEAFDELKNLERKSGGVKGQLNTGDTFDCTEEMAKYLMGENKLNKVVVKVIEVKPEKIVEKIVEKVIEDKEEPFVGKIEAPQIVIEEEKPKKKNNKRAK